MTEKFHCEQESERDHVFEACFAKSLMELVKKSKAYSEIQRRNAELESQLNASLAARDILQSQLAELQGRVVEWRSDPSTLTNRERCLILMKRSINGSRLCTSVFGRRENDADVFHTVLGDLQLREVVAFVPLSSLPLPKGE